MCQFCWEEIGARVVAADVRGEPRPADFDAPWCQPMLLQEGVPGVAEAVAAPVTRRCLALQATWHAGEALPAPPSLPEGHAFGAWRAPPSRAAAAPADRAGAVALLWRYRKWAMAAAERHIWRGTPADAALVLEAFPALWAGWLVVEDAPQAPGVLPLARGLATGAPVLTEETVELWLQRRAALLWCDAAGFGALLDLYRTGDGLRPFLAHWAALRRPPAPAERARLVALAERHGETAALDLLPA